MKYKRYVLDTSAFTGLGESKTRVEKHIKTMIEIVSKSKKHAVSFYIPPSVWEELVGLLERKNISPELISRLDAWTVQKPPSRMELQMPSEFLYQYVIEIRERLNKGLREAEKAVLKTKHHPEGHEQVIKELREGYKEAMRKGMLDSKEDLDVILLAKEMNADIIAKDEGIANWAKTWGIRFIDAEKFDKIIRSGAK
jgi:hypothetical protein